MLTKHHAPQQGWVHSTCRVVGAGSGELSGKHFTFQACWLLMSLSLRLMNEDGQLQAVSSSELYFTVPCAVLSNRA